MSRFSASLIPTRVTLTPGQELSFQASRCLLIVSSSGTVQMSQSGSNRFPGAGYALPPGFKMTAGFNPDGSPQEIGLVYFRNTSTTNNAFVDVVTSNCEIEVDYTVNSSAIAQRNNVYSANFIGTSGAFIGVLSMDTAQPKAIRLLSVTLQNPGTLPTATQSILSVGRLLAGGSPPSGGSLFTTAIRTNPAGPVNLATIRGNNPTIALAPGASRNLARINIGTTEPDFRPMHFDLTEGGTVEPLTSEVGAVNAGFFVQLGAGVSPFAITPWLTLTWAEE